MAGHDNSFIAVPPEDLTCLLCTLVARNPRQSTCKCGRIYCQTCVEKLQASYSNRCPTCRETLHTFEDNLSLRRVRALRVRCDHHKAGCEWIGELGDLDGHLKSCTQRQQMVQCCFTDIGCRASFLESERETHDRESVRQHLNMAVHCLRAEMRLPPRVFKIENFSAKRRIGEPWFSSGFYSHVGGYRMCLKVFPDGVVSGRGKCMSVTVVLMRGENDDHLIWPFRGEVTFSVLNQASDNHHVTETAKFDRTEGSEVNRRVIDGERNAHGRGFPEFLHHRVLQFGSEGRQYLLGDAVYVRVDRVVVYSCNKPWLIPSPAQANY